jgi:hypothetical protein
MIRLYPHAAATLAADLLSYPHTRTHVGAVCCVAFVRVR